MNPSTQSKKLRVTRQRLPAWDHRGFNTATPRIGLGSRNRLDIAPGHRTISSHENRVGDTLRQVADVPKTLDQQIIICISIRRDELNLMWKSVHQPETQTRFDTISIEALRIVLQVSERIHDRGLDLIDHPGIQGVEM
jgi:hypothetical protein